MTFDHLDFDGCPACGEPVDYCPGHGEIADPRGHLVLMAHADPLLIDVNAINDGLGADSWDPQTQTGLELWASDDTHAATWNVTAWQEGRRGEGYCLGFRFGYWGTHLRGEGPNAIAYTNHTGTPGIEVSEWVDGEDPLPSPDHPDGYTILGPTRRTFVAMPDTITDPGGFERWATALMRRIINEEAGGR